MTDIPFIVTDNLGLCHPGNGSVLMGSWFTKFRDSKCRKKNVQVFLFDTATFD